MATNYVESKELYEYIKENKELKDFFDLISVVHLKVTENKYADYVNEQISLSNKLNEKYSQLQQIKNSMPQFSSNSKLNFCYLETTIKHHFEWAKKNDQPLDYFGLFYQCVTSLFQKEDIEYMRQYILENESSNAEIKILSPVEKKYEKWKEAQKGLFDISQTYLDDMEKFSKNNFWNRAKYNAAYKDFKKFEYLYDEKERYENQINYINSLTYQQIKLLVEVYEAFNKTKGFNKESEDKIRELKDNHARIKENCAANIIFKAKSEGIISAFELERVYYELFKIIVLDKFGKISYDDKTTSVNLEQGDTIDAFFYDKSLKELIDSFLKLDAIKNLEDLYLSKLEELNPKEIKKLWVGNNYE